jgi:pimeloyl-ACP methyl ester carboxylesterase
MKTTAGTIDLTSMQFGTGQVTSADGTRIGYRQFGSGPGLILVHGGLQTSQNFTRLAAALSDVFTVYVPDRRGRGLSGSHGVDYTIRKECEDINALLNRTGAHNLFGLSSGALIVLQAALTFPAIYKVALYEPPLPTDRSSPATWAPRYEKELAEGKLASAMVTIIKGTGDSSIVSALPRFILEPMMTLAIRSESSQSDEVPLKTLIPTVHFDTQLVAEMEGSLENFKAIRAEVLLLGGSKSQAYLKAALDASGSVLPHARRVEYPGLGHLATDNDGKPELIAQDLHRFFLP